jgi:hypothetical protein
VAVPLDAVRFGHSAAHVERRRQVVQRCHDVLDAVVVGAVQVRDEVDLALFLGL